MKMRKTFRAGARAEGFVRPIHLNTFLFSPRENAARTLRSSQKYFACNVH
jgi:hypothetical protein